MKRLVIVLVLGGVGLASFLAWRRAQATSVGAAFSTAVIEADEVDVAARVGGRLLSVAVDEGDVVEAGALVARLDCEPLLAQRRQLVAQHAQATSEARALGIQVEGVTAQHRGALDQVRSARERVEALRAQRDVAAREAERIQRLGEHASESQRDRVTTEAQGLALQVEASQRDVRALRAQARAVDANEESASARAEAALHAVEALSAGIERLDLEIAECDVHAPSGGVVETRFFEPGEIIGVGRPVVRLVDLDSTTVTAYVTGPYLADVHPGAEASIRVDAFPGESFTGRVTTVAVEAAFTPRNIQTRSDRDRLVYPVKIELANPEHRLLPGMPVEVRLGSE